MDKPVKIGYEFPRSRPRFEDVQRDQDLFEKFNRRRNEILASLGRQASVVEIIAAVNRAHFEIYSDNRGDLTYELD